MRTPGRINRKIIDYKTKEGKALYERSTRLIYSDSEGNIALISEGLITLTVLLAVHAKSCGWDIFNVPILNTGSTK